MKMSREKAENLNRCKRRALYKTLKLPTEEQDQTEIFDWIVEEKIEGLYKLYSIPNGAYVNIKTAKRLKLTGLKSGVPDMCLPVARQGYHGLYLELKRLKPKGVTSSNQKERLLQLNKDGYKAIICYGSGGAKKELLDYIK